MPCPPEGSVFGLPLLGVLSRVPRDWWLNCNVRVENALVIGSLVIGHFMWVIHGSGGKLRGEGGGPHSDLDTCRVPLIGVRHSRTSARAWGWRDDLRGSLTEGGES